MGGTFTLGIAGTARLLLGAFLNCSFDEWCHSDCDEDLVGSKHAYED